MARAVAHGKTTPRVFLHLLCKHVNGSEWIAVATTSCPQERNVVQARQENFSVEICNGRTTVWPRKQPKEAQIGADRCARAHTRRRVRCSATVFHSMLLFPETNSQV
ncbi:unnamed protein product [Caenorhabditis auriculariae]|uniref:Uncharacterized protein n=1 Tax=Caenorhabditis auriculariae TaxID=2777116 RepID=A0A8S1GWH2_9PELO|nr:unnamed protein product [Caenorhabditis auriculariae]